ncbi:MAG: hypothetical protein JW788_05155, partial [Candidatus Omnitrophica bacterium]|nr:hypothetical protein [Candidatus Omnitrophota bacterium]
SWESTPEVITLTYQQCELNGVKYWGLPEGMELASSYQIEGIDVYGNTYTQKINNTYEVINGKLSAIKSVSQYRQTCQDNSWVESTTTTTYTYGEFDFNGQKYFGLISTEVKTSSNGKDEKGKAWNSGENYTLTYQQCELNGVKYWGLPEGMEITTTHEGTTKKYEIHFGKLQLISSSSSGSSTVNHYDWFEYQGQRYWGVISQDYDFSGEKIHLDLSVQSYEGRAYWGLKEGPVEGHPRAKVKYGALSYERPASRGGGKGGKLSLRELIKKCYAIKGPNNTIIFLPKNQRYRFQRDGDGNLVAIFRNNERRDLFWKADGTIVTHSGTVSYKNNYDEEGNLINTQMFWQAANGQKLTLTLSAPKEGIYTYKLELGSRDGEIAVLSSGEFHIEMGQYVSSPQDTSVEWTQLPVPISLENNKIAYLFFFDTGKKEAFDGSIWIGETDAPELQPFVDITREIFTLEPTQLSEEYNIKTINHLPAGALTKKENTLKDQNGAVKYYLVDYINSQSGKVLYRETYDEKFRLIQLDTFTYSETNSLTQVTTKTFNPELGFVSNISVTDYNPDGSLKEKTRLEFNLQAERINGLDGIYTVRYTDTISKEVLWEASYNAEGQLINRTGYEYFDNGKTKRIVTKAFNPQAGYAEKIEVKDYTPEGVETTQTLLSQVNEQLDEQGNKNLQIDYVDINNNILFTNIYSWQGVLLYSNLPF